ncbi:MAG: ROK family protein [Ardenticatenaceae bacterium]|nr:ROK family protein [Ardenticatenaceae bacterium]
MITLGIDIGGSGIKGALVDTVKGEMVTDRLRIPTPQPAKPQAVIGVLKQIADHFEYSGPIGVGIPCIVINGVTLSAANIDDEWIGFAAEQAMGEVTGRPVTLGNDADVAGLAEMRFGAGREQMGTVMIFTLGTGIGSAVFVNGRIVPNTELGHVFLRNQKKDAEAFAAERIRDEKKLSWKQWGKRLNTYFQHMEFLFSPELFIIGGGISKQHAEFLPYIKTRARMVPAELRNEAGIIGAAVLAAEAAGQ